VCLFTDGHSRRDASDFVDSVDSRSAPSGKVFEKVLVERKEGEAAAEAAVFKGRGVIVEGIEGESSFEGSSCGVAMLGFFDHTER
jgi:hypothetical protein